MPPVVNAIMAQAAEQADTSWLRDQDFDGDPEIDDPPPFQLNPGNQPPPDVPPPDERERPPQPVCDAYTEGRETTLTQDASRPTGDLPLTLEGNDRGVHAFINGTSITGNPRFSLTVDGAEVWSYDQRHLGGSMQEEPQRRRMDQARAPDEWVLSWDLTGVLYESFDLSLITLRCEVPSDGR